MGLKKIEIRVAQWMEANGLAFLRISVGIVFVWYGVLKFFPGLSPAEGLATKTISTITFGLIPPGVIMVGLASWEVLIGLSFVAGKFLRVGIILLLAQMPGTFTPVVLFPADVFTVFPYGLTIEGQYIFKNIVIISAAFVIGSRIFARKQTVDA